MKIAIVAAGFTPGEADKLRRAMATFKRVGTIGTFQHKMIEGMVANGYERDFAERCFHQIEGFGEYGFPGKPRGELRASGLCLGLAQVPLPGRLLRRAPQRPADGLLRAGADRARRARARRRGAPARRQFFRLGLDAGAGPARVAEGVFSLTNPVCTRCIATWRNDMRTSHAHPARPARDQGAERRGCEGDRGETRCVLPPALRALFLYLPLKGGSAARSEGRVAVTSMCSKTSDPHPHPSPVQGEGTVECARRGNTQYYFVRDLWLRTGLPPRVLERLADADAFGSLGLTRRDALWAVKALQPRRRPTTRTCRCFRAGHRADARARRALPPCRSARKCQRLPFPQLSLRAHPAVPARRSERSGTSRRTRRCAARRTARGCASPA